MSTDDGASQRPAEVEGAVDGKYILRPQFEHKFKPIAVKPLIHEVLNEYFETRKEYDANEVNTWSSDVCEEIKSKLKDLGLERYKFVVQVLIGEQRGAGVKTTTRCFWDNESDSYATDVFMNENFFCVASAYGCFVY